MQNIVMPSAIMLSVVVTVGCLVTPSIRKTQHQCHLVMCNVKCWVSLTLVQSGIILRVTLLIVVVPV